MEIKVLKPPFSVCKVEAWDGVDLTSPFTFTACTDEEKSLVCATECVPDHTITREDGWRGMRIQGVLDFSLVGILARIASLLAAAGIAIFAVSTYNTDYLFVKDAAFEKALQILQENGYEMV